VVYGVKTWHRTLSKPVYSRTRRNGLKRLDDDLGLDGRRPWRKLPNALRDVAAWAVWKYTQIPRRGQHGRPYRLDLGDGTSERITPKIIGIYSRADLLTLPAFAAAFRGTPKSRRTALLKAIARVERIVRAAEKISPPVL
jgi:hypothetical protein